MSWSFCLSKACKLFRYGKLVLEHILRVCHRQTRSGRSADKRVLHRCILLPPPQVFLSENLYNPACKNWAKPNSWDGHTIDNRMNDALKCPSAYLSSANLSGRTPITFALALYFSSCPSGTFMLPAFKLSQPLNASVNLGLPKSSVSGS